MMYVTHHPDFVGYKTLILANQDNIMYVGDPLKCQTCRVAKSPIAVRRAEWCGTRPVGWYRMCGLVDGRKNMT